MRSSSRLLWRVERRKMTRTELIVQLLKIAIGLVFGAYFVWWSLEVLDRLTPEYDVPTAVVGSASCRSPPRRSGVRGCGRASASTRTARPRTATRRRARPRWWRSLRVGDASEAFLTLRVKQAKNNSLKSVVVRVVRADVHPLIAVPNYAGVRVVSGIVVGISRRETQTCACYEWHKAPT